MSKNICIRTRFNSKCSKITSQNCNKIEIAAIPNLYIVFTTRFVKM